MGSKHGDILLLSESKSLLGLGVPGIVAPKDLADGRLADVMAVLLDRDVEERLGRQVKDQCARQRVPVFEAVIPVSTGLVEDGEIFHPVLRFLKQHRRLIKDSHLAPESYDKIQLRTLVDIITTTNSLLKPREVMESVMSQISELILCEAWSVLIVDEKDPRQLTFSAAFGPKKESLFSLTVPIGAGIAGWVAEHGQPVIVNNVHDDPRFLKLFDQDTQFRTQNILCAPLVSRGRTIGVIEMLNRKEADGFSEEDLELVQILVNPAAVAIENAFLFQRTEKLTIQDDLTKLYNSRYLNRCLDFELQRAKRLKQPLSLLFLDLDGFKKVNDSFGHLQGSRSLVEIAGIIKAAARETDIVGRYGGDEFMLLLPSTDKAGAHMVAERIRHHVSEYCLRDIKMTASIGIASYPEDGQERDVLIRLADSAMYWIKDRGKNGIASAEMTCGE